MRLTCLAMAVVSFALCAADDPEKPTEVTVNDVGRRVVICGNLGQPIGEEVTVRGRKVPAGKGDQINFFVEAVNGQPLKPPTTIQVPRIIDWPIGTRAEIVGQEEGTITFTDIRNTALQNDDPRFVLRQKIYLHFKASVLKDPGDLKLGDEFPRSRR
jgi:hypothetical protein